MLSFGKLLISSDLDWSPSPLPRGLFFFYCDKFTTFSHLKSRLLTTGLRHPLFIGVTAFVFRFTNDTLEKFLLAHSRHARSSEMRCRLYYDHPKFGQVRLPTNAAMFLNYIGQQTCQDTFAQINGHLNPFVNSNNCNFALIKHCYAGGVFCRN